MKDKKIELTVVRFNPKETQSWWSRFKEHHYLDGTLIETAIGFVFFWNQEPVGFSAIRTSVESRPNCWVNTRMVVLPDYQGMGFGSRMSRWMGEYIARQGGILLRHTSNYKMFKFLEKDPYHEVTQVTETKFSPQLIKNGRYTTIPAGIDPATYKAPYTLRVATSSGRVQDYYIWHINSKKVSAKYNGYDYVTKPHQYLVIDGNYSEKGINDILDHYIKPENYNFVCIGNRTNKKFCFGILRQRKLRGYYAEFAPGDSRVRPNRFTEKVIYVHPEGEGRYRHCYEGLIKEDVVWNEDCVNSSDCVLF